ncbi:MAG: hypothetical protein PHG83_02505 [Patescibacteria group bacterium]|nr:hypothetical protein [Patescibacteria group bacterium]
MLACLVRAGFKLYKKNPALALRILSVLFVIGVGLSLLIPYLLASQMLPVSCFFFSDFLLKFSFIILPLFVIWLGLLLAKGKWREIKNHARVLIVFAAIFSVVTLCVVKYTKIVNVYGVYGHYIENADGTKQFFKENYLNHIDQGLTPLERETAYREYMLSVYDLEFKKMWTFSAFVFLSAFLLLAVIPKRK